MNPTVKAQWIAALRSGEYSQTEGQLRSYAGYCCLGVLCDLHAKAGLGAWDDLSYDDTFDLLPDAVAAWAKVNTSPRANGAPLVDLNDGIDGHPQHTFAQIADLIEEFL